MDNFMWNCLMRIDPFIQEDEIEEARMINEFDILFVFKDGRRFIFDSDTNYFWQPYSEEHELTDDQIRHEFKIRLRTMMRRRCINQEELAARLGTKQAVISRYVTGDAMPSYATMFKIARILNCSMDDFSFRHF